MAGAGRRTFQPGEVLTASNVMNYLQDQTVMNFAGTAARGSAIGTAVSEGMVSYLADSNVVQAYDGSAWNSLAYASSVPSVNSIGLVPIVPTSITNSSGSASYDSTTGLVTFTGVTSVSLNGVFTSSYDHYRYILEPVTASGASDIGVRFRSAGTDSSVNLYNQYWSMSNFSSGSYQSNNSTNTSGALFNTVGLTNRFVCGSGDIHSPLIARATSIFYQGFGYNNTNSYLVSSGVNLDNTSTYDGITLFMRTGGLTMTGTIKIYGYK